MMWLLLLLVLILMFGLTAFIGAPYVPSHGSAIKKAFSELRPVGVDDLVVDIGSGDGKVLKCAAERGARAYGIEINPILIAFSYIRNRQYRALVGHRLANLWQVNFPADTTVVYVFGDSRDIKKMYKKVQLEANRLNRPIDLLSYGFMVPEVIAERDGHGFFLYHVTPLQTRVA